MRSWVLVAILAGCKYEPSASPGDGAVAPDTNLADAPVGAWLEPWSHRVSITIRASEVSAPSGGLLEFPVFVALDDPAIAAIARADGDDFAFTGDDAMSQIPSEIESYADGKLAAWVRVPVLDDTADTRLYLYFGNEAAEPDDGEDVWSNNFLAVWHLSQSPDSGDEGEIEDATDNDHDGTAEGGFLSNDAIDGKVGRAIDFNGISNRIRVPTAVNVGDAFTLSAWVLLTGGTGIKTVFSNSISGLDRSGFRLFVDSDATSDRMVLFETSNGDGPSHQTATTPVNMVPAMTWTHLAVVANRGGGSARIFVDGVDRTVGASIRTDFANTASIEIGRMGDEFEWPGVIDEVELATELRPAEWILTSFTNQDDPAGFYLVGPVEPRP